MNLRVVHVFSLQSGGIIPYDLCKYPHTPATYFGGTAAALLLVAQLFVHAFAGCMCCTKRADASGRSVKVAWATLFFSWYCFYAVGSSKTFSFSILSSSENGCSLPCPQVFLLGWGILASRGRCFEQTKSFVRL